MTTPDTGQYIVVARRYRPQSFGELVGQRQVSQALANAITTNRVGHAYLFTGARGVGKTSTARILAKCLNCASGPTPTPCGQCESCIAIATGEDVDVLEIDGASNRGIDEIRQLRANVNIRPSRSRYKIYIIDEVHMLTTPAFNALLKTLEEPPEHVKFIFCTTDAEKIPITVLSRCQRFDFAGIPTDAIVGRLRQIVQSEGIEADDEALALLARRAGGSMRDSQSLLEQLLSFGGERLTLDDVHNLLGTAHSGRVWKIVGAVVARDAATGLAELDAALGEGVDVGQLLEQLLGYFRDMMAVAVGCKSELMLHTSKDEFAELDSAAGRLGLETILAAVQILDEATVRMRQSTQTRMVAEAALVRLCHLEQLDDVAALIQQLKNASNAPATATRPAQSPVPASARPTPEKKTPVSSEIGRRIDAGPSSSPANRPHVPAKPASGESAPTAVATITRSQETTGPTIALNEQSVESVWQQALLRLEGMTSTHASRAVAVAISGPNRLAIRFPSTYTSSKTFFERPQCRQELEASLQAVVGQPVKIDLESVEGTQPAREQPRPKVPQAQLKKQVVTHPAIQAAVELFDASVISVDAGRAIAGGQNGQDGPDV
jgi:DNA polymerase-3 subunit gamma/tau